MSHTRLLLAGLLVLAGVIAPSPFLALVACGSEDSSCDDREWIVAPPGTRVEVSIWHLTFTADSHVENLVVVQRDGVDFLGLPGHSLVDFSSGPDTRSAVPDTCSASDSFEFSGDTTSILAEQRGSISGWVTVSVTLHTSPATTYSQSFTGTGPDCMEWILDPGK